MSAGVQGAAKVGAGRRRLWRRIGVVAFAAAPLLVSFGGFVLKPLGHSASGDMSSYAIPVICQMGFFLLTVPLAAVTSIILRLVSGRRRSVSRVLGLTIVVASADTMLVPIIDKGIALVGRDIRPWLTWTFLMAWLIGCFWVVLALWRPFANGTEVDVPNSAPPRSAL